MSINNYPLTYKKRVIEFYNNRDEYTINNLLDIFNISNGTLYNWINKNKTNELKEKKKYNKISKYTPEIKCYIRSYVLRNKIFDYKKLIKLINKKYNVTAGKTKIYEILKEMDLTRKRINKRFFYGDQNKHKIKLKNFKTQIKSIKMTDIISIDETSIDTRIIPIYGWSTKGKKIELKVNALKKRYTVICGISNTKLVYHKIINGSANATDFKDFLININKMVNNKYFLLDNARIHHSKLVKNYINTTTNKLLYNVPYSPEFNPIEHIFSILKNTIRKQSTNSNSVKLKININNALNKITENCITNCYIKSLTV